jgi:hypothetical protein
MNGLIIKSPWIERILEAPRTWAIRGTRTNTRGRVALIAGRSGPIVGTCEIVDCLGPMTLEELRAEAGKQQVPVEMLMSSPGAKSFAWILSEVKALAEPIPCSHATTSTMWMKLTPENVPSRYSELEDQMPAQTPPKLEVTITPLVAELPAQTASATEQAPSSCPVESVAA